MSSFWGPGTIGRPDPDRQRRAQRLIERFHAGLLDGAAYLRGLHALFLEEFSSELGVSEPGVQVDVRTPPQGPPPVPASQGAASEGKPSPREAWGPVGPDDRFDDADAIRRMFPTRDDAPGLWLVFGSDRCHFCGRQIPVLALKAGGDDPGGWVHVCLDDLELIRSQAEGALEGQDKGQDEGRDAE